MVFNHEFRVVVVLLLHHKGFLYSHASYFTVFREDFFDCILRPMEGYAVNEQIYLFILLLIYYSRYVNWSVFFYFDCLFAGVIWKRSATQLLEKSYRQQKYKDLFLSDSVLTCYIRIKTEKRQTYHLNCFNCLF